MNHESERFIQRLSRPTMSVGEQVVTYVGASAITIGLIVEILRGLAA